MRTRTIFQCAIALGAVLALDSAAWAQSASPARTDDPARPQVQSFEILLGRALETAGRNFSTRAMEMAPQLMPVAFPTGENPQVVGVAVREMGLYVFNVQVPAVDISLQVLNLMVNRPQLAPNRPDGAQPVNQGRVQSTGVVTPDPMGPSASPSASRLDFRVEYRNQVREALIDAIVDNFGVLPLAANDTVLVIAGGMASPLANPYQRGTSHRLVLRARSSDLVAFRENRITREEMERRVNASEF